MTAKSSLKTPRPETRMTREERRATGKALRDQASLKSHANWKPDSRRQDPVDILVKSSRGRVRTLLPIRYGRMMASPFAFYRGAAAIMAADLGPTPVSGIRVQACGDCHLMNFGGFATPERRIIFDINDFDETLPAPWEWDVKRLAASFLIAARNNKFSEKEARECAQACVRAYREQMARLSEMSALERWYARLDLETMMGMLPNKEAKRFLQKRVQKAASRSIADDDFPALASSKGGKHVINDNPPLIFHPAESQHPAYQRLASKAFRDYRATLADDRRLLLDHYELKDLALKVVGVGSVGTRCGILLLMAGDDDPLFLQFKEARMSVLEPYAGRSIYSNRGERIVAGLRLMQSASDIFLGWSEGGKGIHYYFRQLRDMKLKPLVETFDERIMKTYAGFCGWTLARAHAKSGYPSMISGYLGNSERFDEAVADFGVTYANQNEKDYRALLKAIRAGKIEAHQEP